MTDYIKVPLERAYKGNVLDARDYVVERAKKYGFGLAFILNEEVIKIEPNELDHGFVLADPQRSQFSKQKYKLISYMKPQPKIEEKKVEQLQDSLF